MTPPTIFFEDGERPEPLPEPPLFPLSPGALDDDADAAAMTLLVVWTLLKVLLPLTDTTVVLNCWVTLPVRLDKADDEAVEWVELRDIVEARDSVVVRTCEDDALTVDA